MTLSPKVLRMKSSDRDQYRAKRDSHIDNNAACKGDERFVLPSLGDQEITALLGICQFRCTVREECLEKAMEEPLPVGFVVAGGMRWRSWTFCVICAKKCRGLPYCRRHLFLVYTLDPDYEDTAEIQ